VLADVPESTSHFPKLDQLIKEGEGVYRWEMEKVGAGSASIQTQYACEYTSDASTRDISWKPAKTKDSNAQVSGTWKITDNGNGTDLVFTTQATLTLPLPKLTRAMISPVVKSEFEGMIDKYISNLHDVFKA
jgi:carbon monoxide dehydrogenase subunit G